MLEVTRTISTSRRLRPRIWAPLLASAIAAIAVVGLLTSGGHAGTHSSGPSGGSSPPVPVTHSSPGTCAPRFTTAQPRLTRALDAALRAVRVRLHAPAATAAVVVCGHMVWADASGVVDVGSGRPATNRSLFVLNSAAKTFVATMVMQEIQDGHLSLDTKLSQFYPWLPNTREITVRVLLNMTSGLPDYLSNPRIEQTIKHEPRHHWTVDQVLTGLGSGLGTPKFLPGRGFQYSDTNYIVLGGILERITHRPLESVFQELIAKPLGMTTATFVPTAAAKALIAHPYLLDSDDSPVSQWIPGFGVSTAVWGPVFTDGGLAASSLDVARFSNALLAGRLVSPAAVTQMTHIGSGDYGFGMRARSFGHHYWLGHRGYFGGFEAENWTDPSRRLTIAVATNLQVAGGEPTSTRIWEALTQAFDRQRS
jgi:D-alanyl-D-alanine carboxypeptidase